MAMGDPVKIMSVHLAWSEKDLGKDGIWAKTRTAMGSWSSGYDVSLTREEVAGSNPAEPTHLSLHDFVLARSHISSIMHQLPWAFFPRCEQACARGTALSGMDERTAPDDAQFENGRFATHTLRPTAQDDRGVLVPLSSPPARLPLRSHQSQHLVGQVAQTDILALQEAHDAVEDA